MRHPTKVATAVAAASLLVACAGEPDTVSSTPTSDATTSVAAPTSPPAPTEPLPPPPTTPTPQPTSEPLTLAFVGDMNFETETRDRLDADPGSVFGAALPLLGAADLTFGNLETAITEGGSPEPKAYTFRAPATAFDALEIAGFDAVSMANNHGVDYGAEGLADTLDAIDETSVAVAGIGPDAARAYAPVFLEAKGRRVAFLAALDLHDETWRNWGASDSSGGVARYDERFVESVRVAAQDADLTIAYLHWAPENDPCPDPDTAPPIVDALVAAGADVVIGAHAHMLQGAGWRDQAFVAYGMGNYLWYFQRVEQTTRTGILTLTVDGASVVGYDYAPARIGSDDVPTPMAGAEADVARQQFEELRSCTDLAAEPG